MEKQVEDFAVEAFNTIAAQLGSAGWASLPDEVKSAWCRAVVHAQIYCEFPEVVNPIPQGGHAARCAWGVMAGVIPGKPVPDLTKQWAMTSDEFEGGHGPDIFSWRTLAATSYLQELHNPNRLNWARLEWIWY